MKAKIAGVALAAVMACGWVSGASASTLHLATTLTRGTFESGAPGASIPDTTAAFSFDISQDSAGQYSISNGVFTDENLNLDGQKVRAFDLVNFSVDPNATQTFIVNTDGAMLAFDSFFISMLDFNGPNVAVYTGGYSFTGAVGETAEGSYNLLVSQVPLPSSAPMFGAAVLALGAATLMRRRRASAQG